MSGSKKDWLKILFKSLGLVVLILIAFVITNSEYFWKNLSYDLNPKKSAIDVPADIQNRKKMQPNFLIVPSLGIQAPIQYADQVSEQAFQAALQSGVVHYPNTAKPGEFGNSYVFGHSSDYAFTKGQYKTVFALLPKIEIGAEIFISNDTGDEFVYKVSDKLVVNPNETKYLDQNQNKEQLLTLQTSYPVGTALKRFLVIAHLEK